MVQPYRYALLATLLIAFAVEAMMLVSRDVRSPVGFALFLPVHMQSPDKCGDGSQFVLDVLASRKLALNGSQIDFTQLHDKLVQTYGRRVERVLFVRREKNLDVADIAGVIDIAQGSIPNLHIGLLTPAVKEPCLVIHVSARPMPPRNF